MYGGGGGVGGYTTQNSSVVRSTHLILGKLKLSERKRKEKRCNEQVELCSIKTQQKSRRRQMRDR